MELRLNDNERVFADAVAPLVGKHMEPPREAGVSRATYSSYSAELRESLKEGGFLDAAREADFGPVCAALLVEEAAKSPLCAEIGTSALVAAMVCDELIDGPIAIVEAAKIDRPIRYLTVARTLLVVSGDDLVAVDLDGAAIERNGGMYAYPMGTFSVAPDLVTARRVGDGRKARLYWQIAIAAEGAALMQAALDYTVDYVKNRRQFGRPIGSFQAIKHRLASDAQKTRGAIWLARRAAWSGNSADAAMAALYVQSVLPDIVYDCHQFMGAMGMTLECPLHFWTYRLKALQSELGGAAALGTALAREQWLA